MADAITIKALQDASLDAKSLEEVVNGNETKQVTTRLGESYPSVKKAIKTLFENGGLPATPFKTKAEMESSELSNGAYAYVLDGKESNVYRKEDDEWILVYSDPYSKSIDFVKDYGHPNIEMVHVPDTVFAFVDENGRLGVSIDSDANIQATNIKTWEDLTSVFVVTDANDRIALEVDSNGFLKNKSISSLENRVENLELGVDKDKEYPSLLEYNEPVKTDYMHIFSYGQSLSRGHNAYPVVSTSQPYNNLMFASGVLPRADTVGHDFTSFFPLVEQLLGSEGETPISGMLNTLTKYRVEEGGESNKWVFVGTASGRGSASLAELEKGTIYYNGMVEQVQAAYDIAQSQGKTYSLWALAWIQGETDHQINTNPEDYKNRLVGLQESLFEDVNSITNQGFRFPVVHYQVSSHRQYKKEEMPIALAHLELSEERDDFILATPVYHMPYSDGVHLKNTSSEQLGKYLAKSLNYTLTTGDKWHPLKPVKITRQGTVLSVEFNKDGLVFDTTEVTETHNMGFDIWKDGVLQDIISSVAIVDSNRVLIKTSQPISDGCYLSYAKGRVGDPQIGGPISGARGNLRDSEGDTDNYVNSKGETKYMHNWCVLFEHLIK